jgi:uncharacterized protein YegL
MNKHTRLVKLEARLNPPLAPLILMLIDGVPMSDTHGQQVLEAERKGREVRIIDLVIVRTREDVERLRNDKI